MQRDYSILIGACGWQHPQWQESFYPEDLPEDWLLGYYSNEFPVTLIPADKWQDGDRLDDWLEDSEASLRFVGEFYLDEKEIPKIKNQLTKLGDRLLGIVIKVPETSLNSQHIEKLEEQIMQWQWGVPLCLDFMSRTPEHQLQNRLQTLNIGWCWHGDDTADGLSCGTFVVTRINETSSTPKELRLYVETCLKQVGDQRHVVLLFDGQPPSLESMRNAGVILDLL